MSIVGLLRMLRAISRITKMLLQFVQLPLRLRAIPVDELHNAPSDIPQKKYPDESLGC